MVTTSGVMVLEFSNVSSFEDIDRIIRPDDKDVLGTVRRFADFVNGCNAGMYPFDTVSGTWFTNVSGTTIDPHSLDAGTGSTAFSLGII